MADRRDFLDEIVDERSKQNPEFPELLQVALKRRELGRERATVAQDRQHTTRPAGFDDRPAR